MRKLAPTLFVAAGIAAMAYASPHAHADTTAYVEADDNRATMQEFVDVVGALEEKYGTGPIVIDTGYLGGPTVYAGADNAGITVNKWTSTSTPAQINAAVASDVASGYHNGGCDGVATIAVHETAHVIDQRRGFIGRARLAKNAATMTGEIAGYSFNSDGSLNPAEAVAEAFQAVECGSASAVDYEIYRMLVN